MKFMDFVSKFIFMSMSYMTMNFHEPYEFQALILFPTSELPGLLAAYYISFLSKNESDQKIVHHTI